MASERFKLKVLRYKDNTVDDLWVLDHQGTALYFTDTRERAFEFTQAQADRMVESFKRYEFQVEPVNPPKPETSRRMILILTEEITDREVERFAHDLGNDGNVRRYAISKSLGKDQVTNLIGTARKLAMGIAKFGGHSG